MSLSTNIALWTTSLFLAFFGIIFGILAFINSSKANINIKKLISTTWTSDVAQNLFFKNLRKVSTISKQLVKKLEKKTQYYEYSIKASQTRLAVISKQVAIALKSSEYSDIAKDYIEYKNNFDHLFSQIIPSIDILGKDENISISVRKKLIVYHKEVILACADLMGQFGQLSINSNKEKNKL